MAPSKTRRDAAVGNVSRHRSTRCILGKDYLKAVQVLPSNSSISLEHNLQGGGLGHPFLAKVICSLSTTFQTFAAAL